MPAKNSIKKYIENGYYHIYNRGVEKRLIFQDEQDYGVFLSYLKEYLTPKDIGSLQSQLASPSASWREKDKIVKAIHLNNFFDDIKLLSYCLMPNHFHLLINQFQSNSIDLFINSLNTRYVVYFNKKYKRVGPLFQGVYKAVLVETDEQLLYLSNYIHRNPIKRVRTYINEENYIKSLLKQPSSLPDYLGIRKTQWLNKNTILSFFNSQRTNLSYKKYEEFILGEKYPNPSITNLKID